MPRIARVGRFLAIVVLLLAGGAPSARADAYGYDVRLRIGGYFPSDLPTSQGTMWGLEVRDRINARNGITYGIGWFDEQRTDYMDLNFGGAPATFTFHAEVKLQPLLFSWYHVWPMPAVDIYAGVGAGFYPVQASSAGFNRQIGVGVKDVGDFRFLQDQTNFGAFAYGGIDFYPESRWGIMIEGRGHFVSQGYSAIEISTGGIF